MSLTNVLAVCSMLHEPASINLDAPAGEAPIALNSATRLFRGEPVLGWTLNRLQSSRRLTNLAIIAWDDQLSAIEPIADEFHADVLAKSPRQPIAELDAVAAARRWHDGWRGGLLGTCDFDLGFHAAWFAELAGRLAAQAIVLVDPSAGLVDAALIDQLIEHAEQNESLDLVFSQAAPGLGGLLLRAAMLEKLCASREHPGRALHYSPAAPVRDPIASAARVNIAMPIARSTRSFKLDSHRQIARLTEASQSLNGSLASSAAEALVERLRWSSGVDILPRELVIELNTARRTRPIFSPLSHLTIKRNEPATLDAWINLLRAAAGADDLRLTIGGVGDPLESELLFPLIDAARSAGVRAIHVQTDLLIDDSSLIERLAASAIDLVEVNIPAMTPATYEALMGIDGLRRVLENVATFIRARVARQSGLPLLVPVFIKCEKNLAEMESWYDQWLGALGCAVIDGPPDFAGQIPSLALAQMAPAKRSPCARLNSRLTVLCDGRAVACEQDVNAKKVLGDIRIDSLEQIWQTKLEPLRLAHARGEDESHPLCARCTAWHRN